jgi:hypothetical protein
MIKVSDLKYLFGHVTQAKPLYRSIDSSSQERVPGFRSEKLKFAARLCAQCNNARTQAHDKSWEALARFLRKRSPVISPGEVIRLARAFENGLRPGLLGVHLYFVKLLGCLIHDGGVPLDTSSFAESILRNEPHPHVYLAFFAVTSRRFQDHAFVTPVETVTVGGVLSGATWFYFVGRVGVQVTWAPAIHLRSKKVHLWHPSHSKKTIILDGM